MEENIKMLTEELKDYIFTLIPEIFLIIPRKCPFCSNRLVDKINIRYSASKPIDRRKESIIRDHYVWGCLTCRCAFADSNQISKMQELCREYPVKTVRPQKYANAKEMIQEVTIPTQLESTLFEYKAPEQNTTYQTNLLPKRRIATNQALLGRTEQIIDLDEIENISSKDIVVQVYQNKCHCISCEKRYNTVTVVPRTVMIDTIIGETISQTIMFCKKCGQYFISLQVLKAKKDVYEWLLLELVDENGNSYGLSFSGSNSYFAPDSVLSRCGYTVKAGTPIQYRQRILRYVIDSGKATKYKVLELLGGFIQVREYRSELSEACKRWKEDISFVIDYDIESQEKVRGNVSFKRRR